ncbi:unnamed protein product [Schistosoma rodhaini]|uniref:Ig-like domain-containing protein n=1 Tax=Schistosoma rodhaini TaxID=6188 RepID=A0AA85F154_9TREM|nr:unnamed protein product [Schistosoma rodhaini]CAH8662723.1 unnamed protein product [Schistosoma rodhaini]
MYFLHLFLFLFTSVCNTLSDLPSNNVVDIKARDYKLLTKILAVRQLQDLFDNDKNTHGLFHAELNQKVYLIVDLGGLYQVSSVEIASDEPENLKQTISIGYGFDKNTTSLFGSLYNCTYQQTSTLCIPACSQYDNSRTGFVGNSLLWSFQSDKEGWTRIYDLIIRGTPFDENRSMKNNLDDITLFKPYVDHLVPAESMESCNGLLWNLNDESSVTESSTLAATDDRNVTIYFGKTYSVTSVHFVTSKRDDMPQEYTLHFSGMESLTKIINLQNDCTLTASSDNDGANFKEYNCPTTDLESYTFDYVTVNVKGLYKLHVYGLPFHYPKIQIIPSKEDDKTIMVDKNVLQISCIAQSCNSTSNVLLDVDDSYRRSRSSDKSCPMNGHIVRCEYLNLFRLSTSPNDDNNQKIQLTNQGIINTEFSEIMTELRIVQSNAEKLIVTMPRTHQYYSQYECSCQATDNKKSQLFSLSTNLKPTDFDQDFIFQTNYTTIFADQTIESHVGFIELPENEHESYFKLNIIGYSLLKDVQIGVVFVEGGQAGSRTNANIEETSVQAFSGINVGSNLWSIPVYKYELQDVWPDSVDDSVITVTWSMPKALSATKSPSVIRDIFRALIITSSGVNTIRAWVWQRDSHLLDIRAYHQLDENNVDSQLKILTLQRSGCSPSESEDEVVASVQLKDGQCSTDNKDIITCTRTIHGQIIQFKLNNPSTSDVYKLYMKSDGVEDNVESTSSIDLVTSGSLGETVKEDIKDAGLSLTVEGIHHNHETQETELDVAVHIASKVISDNVACRPTYLLLEFIEPNIETLKSRVSSKQTMFRIKLPSNRKEINLVMQLSIGSVDPTQSEATTNQSIAFQNPFYIPTDIKVDAENQLIQWFGLPTIFNNLLHHYETKLSGLPKACEQASEFNLPITQQEIDNGTIYRVNLKNIPDPTITKNGLAIDYNFKVTPVFKGIDGKSITMGTSSDIRFSTGRTGQTDLKAPTSGRYYSLQVQVRPSQIPSCLNLETLNTQFILRVIGEVNEYPDYIKQVNYVPITMKTAETLSDKNNHVKLYKIENLLPGRRYELQAEVIYTEDFRDKISEPVRLWIEDEVHVQTEEVFISPGERVVINCTGSVGPNDTSQKSLEWKLFDGGRLPDGSRSLKTQEAQSGPLWYAMESLIFDPVNKQHGGVYACFIRPSILELMNKPTELHKVTVTVSDLEVDINSKIVEFGEKIIITCRTASPGQLDWILPSGEKVEIMNEMKSDDDNDDQPYTIKDENDDVKLSIKLIIPKVNLNKVGKYTCLHSPSNNKQTFSLKMKEVIKLVKSPESSDKPGKTLILDCTANLGNLHQSVVWYKRPNSNSPWLEITKAIQTIEHITIQQKNPEDTLSSGVWLSELKVKNSPGIIGEFMCTIQDIQTTMNIERMETGSIMTNDNDFSKITHATIKVSLKSVKLENGQISVHCQGYPAHSKDRLQWVYIPLNTDNKSDKVITIVHSNPKDEENEQETDGNTKSLDGKETDEIVSLAFQLTDSIPATWPGSTGPQQLVQAGLIEQEHQPKQMYTAERLSLIFDSKYAEKVADGILSCRYVRPKGILPMDSDEAAESLSKVTIPETNDDSDEILEKSEIPMKTLLDAKQGDDNDNLSILKSSLNEEPDEIQSGDNKNNTEKKSISLLLYINLMALMIIFMRD